MMCSPYSIDDGGSDRKIKLWFAALVMNYEARSISKHGIRDVYGKVSVAMYRAMCGNFV
jgi:hypothetical protein